MRRSVIEKCCFLWYNKIDYITLKNQELNVNRKSKSHHFSKESILRKTGKMETEIKRLLKKIGKFPALADRYQKEVEALSEDSRSARGEERREGMEPQASETMDMELAAYQSVEEAAREFQGRCQEMNVDHFRIIVEE